VLFYRIYTVAFNIKYIVFIKLNSQMAIFVYEKEEEKIKYRIIEIFGLYVSDYRDFIVIYIFKVTYFCKIKIKLFKL